MKPATATIQDDIPPVHVLEAAQNQDRKETEDLLAGFDRPGRSPKPVSKERDFVDYYARKKGGPDSGAARGAGGAAGAAGAGVSLSRGAPTIPRLKQGDVATVVKPRKREGIPTWLAWGGAGLLMVAIGGVVAFLATSDSHPSAATPPTEPTGPSAATTITAATPPKATDSIPPPGPADPSATTTTATNIVAEPTSVSSAAQGSPAAAASPATRGSAKRDPRAAPSAGGNPSVGAAAIPPRGNAADEPKPPPRDDFIRDL